MCPPPAPAVQPAWAGRLVAADSCSRSSVPGTHHHHSGLGVLGAQSCGKHVQGMTCQMSQRAERQDGNLRCQREPCERLFPRRPQHHSFPFYSAKCQICFQPFSICVLGCLPLPEPCRAATLGWSWSFGLSCAWDQGALGWGVLCQDAARALLLFSSLSLGVTEMGLLMSCLCSSWLFDVGLSGSTGHRFGFTLMGPLEGCCLLSCPLEVKKKKKKLQTIWLGEKRE